MPSYLCIELGDPFASRDVENAYRLMADFLNNFNLVWHW